MAPDLECSLCGRRLDPDGWCGECRVYEAEDYDEDDLLDDDEYDTIDDLVDDLLLDLDEDWEDEVDPPSRTKMRRDD